MRTRTIVAACIAALLVAFVIDLATPQLFVVAILLDVPIVLSSLLGSRRFTQWLVGAALVANAIAGYVNGVQEHYHWDRIGLGDRGLAALSIFLVGYLSTRVQEAGRRAGLLAAQEARARREAELGAAMERVRASLSFDLVRDALVREAVPLFGARFARLYGGEPSGATVWIARAGERDVDEVRAPVGSEAASLVQRAYANDDVVEVTRGDPFGRLVLDALDGRAAAALALPLAQRDLRLGVLVLGFDDANRAGESLMPARAFVPQAIAALAQARSFSELGERSERLAERGAIIRDLVYALSHDLRTPLTALQMTLRQARDGAYGELSPRYAEVLGHSIASAEELQRLAETLLLVARFESGDRQPRGENFDLSSTAREIVRELDPLAAARDVRVAVDAPDEAAVRADRGEVRRAAINVVANALEHSPPEGTVRIAVRANGSGVSLTVTDEGRGVPPELRSRLFDRFAAGDARRGAGTGLGLYLARKVAEANGGTLTYRPSEPRGSTFTFTLPRASAGQPQ